MLKRYRTKAEKDADIEADLALLPETQIMKSDKSARFKLIGGKYHDQMVRLYPPWHRLVFPDGETYVIHPPLDKRSKKYVYLHTPKLEDE